MKLKTLTAALALSAFAIAGGSLAASAQQTTINVKDGAGGAIANNVTSFDWAEFGSGMAVGVGPFGTPLTLGAEFDFLYQANLVNFGNQGSGEKLGLVITANGGALTEPVAGVKQFQFTIVGSITERVASITPDGLDADFATVGGTISIFYDEAGLTDAGTQANSLTGEGFDDGIEIARFSVLPGEFSSFEVTSPGTGAGTAQLEFQVSAALDFVDPDFLEGILGAIMDLHFDSNLNYPPGTSNTNGFHIGGSGFYPNTGATNNDIVFKVDGSNTFSYKVPEPATLGLLGAGLVGVCFALRRRSSAAAA